MLHSRQSYLQLLPVIHEGKKKIGETLNTRVLLLPAKRAAVKELQILQISMDVTRMSLLLYFAHMGYFYSYSGHVNRWWSSDDRVDRQPRQQSQPNDPVFWVFAAAREESRSVRGERFGACGLRKGIFCFPTNRRANVRRSLFAFRQTVFRPYDGCLLFSLGWTYRQATQQVLFS